MTLGGCVELLVGELMIMGLWIGMQFFGISFCQNDVTVYNLSLLYFLYT